MEPRRIPLKIVPDEIAVPPGTMTIPFAGGTGYLPGGSQFQISYGSVTFTFDPGYFVVSAKQAQELADRLGEMTRKGRQPAQAAQDITSAIQAGVLGPVSMAAKDEPDEAG